MEFEFVVLGADSAVIHPGGLIRGFQGGNLTYLVRAVDERPIDASWEIQHYLAEYNGEAFLGHSCLTTTASHCSEIFDFGNGYAWWLMPQGTPSPFVEVGHFSYAPSMPFFPYGGIGGFAQAINLFLDGSANGVSSSARLSFIGDPVAGALVQINLTSQLVAPMLPDLTVPISGTASTIFDSPRTNFTVHFDAPQSGAIRVALQLDNFDGWDELLTYGAYGAAGIYTQSVDPDLAALGDFNLMYTLDNGYVDQFLMEFENSFGGFPMISSIAVATSPVPEPQTPWYALMLVFALRRRHCPFAKSHPAYS